MKTLKTVLTHAFIWSGIYWGVLVGFEPVANLTAVIMSLLSLAAIVVAMIAHSVLWLNDSPANFASQVSELARGGVLGWLFRISSYAQAFTLITVGGAWIALGTGWLLAVILLDTLIMWSHKVETETE